MKLFVFGLGYTALRFVQRQRDLFAEVAGTVRTDDKAADLRHQDIEAYRFDTDGSDPDLAAALADSDALLVSVQPGEAGDPALHAFGEAIASASALRRIVYLSTIGVYGDHAGAWIDETAAVVATNARQRARIVAERAWLDLGATTGRTVTILRLAGIYGPGRNALDDLKNGDARRIDKPGQVFNRIHVDDIGRAIAAALGREGPSLVLNVTDDEPAPAPDVVAYAATRLGVTPPPLIPFAEADLSPMARSFYGANRRVGNAALKRELGVDLAYPTYRRGLDALLGDGEGRS